MSEWISELMSVWTDEHLSDAPAQRNFLKLCFAASLLRDWIRLEFMCSISGHDKTTDSLHVPLVHSHGVFDSKHQIKLDITIFSNRFRARLERETRILQSLTGECFSSTLLFSSSLQVHQSSREPRERKKICCANSKREAQKWKENQTNSIMDRSIWQRLKMKWILAIIVIQFIDLSMNRKYKSQFLILLAFLKLYTQRFRL